MESKGNQRRKQLQIEGIDDYQENPTVASSGISRGAAVGGNGGWVRWRTNRWYVN